MSVSATDTHVRVAAYEDLHIIVAAVQDLLTELGSQPPRTAQMVKPARRLLENPHLGALLVAESESAAAEGGPDGAVVGVLTSSFQFALHVPGPYALIQDLWVRPAWRGRSVGRELLGMMFELAQAQGMVRVEVGLPRESFANIRATEAFYARNGFEHLGARMRRNFQ